MNVFFTRIDQIKYGIQIAALVIERPRLLTIWKSGVPPASGRRSASQYSFQAKRRSLYQCDTWCEGDLQRCWGVLFLLGLAVNIRSGYPTGKAGETDPLNN